MLWLNKLKQYFIKKNELSLRKKRQKSYLQNILNGFNLTLADLNYYFPLYKQEINLHSSYFPEQINLNFTTKENKQYYCYKESYFDAFGLSFTIGEHEEKNLYKFLESQNYTIEQFCNSEHIILQNIMNNQVIFLTKSRKRYAMGDSNFSTYFDMFCNIMTNNMDIIYSINEQIFEMSPPWLVFDDYVFAYRNHHWRADWVAFWHQLSEEEKKKYFETFNAPKDWQQWLTDPEFQLYDIEF